MTEENKDTCETQSAKKYTLQYIRGLPFVALNFQAKDIENVIDFKPDDTDIFVVTYPKCGTTWTQFMVWEIIHKGAPPPSPNQMIFRDFPYLEATGLDVLKDLPSPRLMKTHLPFHLNPYNPKAKYIYTVRNPLDCVVSLYHFLNDSHSLPPMTFDEYFELFIAGKVTYGDFFDHALSWYKHRNDPNILYLTYEGMKRDKQKSLLAIAKFLGDSYYEDMKDEEVMDNCMKHTDFSYMKKLGMFFPKEKNDIENWKKRMGDIDSRVDSTDEYQKLNFFRKGEVGDWKNHLSPSQVERFNEYMSNKLKNTEMENFWKPRFGRDSKRSLTV